MDELPKLARVGARFFSVRRAEAVVVATFFPGAVTRRGHVLGAGELARRVDRRIVAFGDLVSACRDAEAFLRRESLEGSECLEHRLQSFLRYIGEGD